MARQVVFDAYGEDAYTKRPDRVDDGPQGRPGGRLRRGAARRDRLRPPAWLPWPRGVRQPAGRPGRARRGARPACSRSRPTATTCWPPVVLQATPPRCSAVLANGDQIQVNGDGLKFVARSLTDKAPPRSGSAAAPSSGSTRRRQRSLARSRTLPQAEAAFVAVSPRDGAHPRAGGRLRLRPQQVQPRRRRRCASPARRSSRSSIRRRWKRASRRRP